MINSQIFREYDIRGLVDEDLTEKTVAILARSIGTFFRQNKVKRVSLGYDARASSVLFQDIFVDELTRTGLDVLNIGLVPTPVLYFSLFAEDVEAGLMITGSHNPANFNGFKICLDKSSIHGSRIQEIRLISESGSFLKGQGSVEKKNIIPDYQAFVCENINLGDRKLKVVIDAGNGVGGIVAAPLYKNFGFETIDLFIEPDCRFPNHHPDPAVVENMHSAINAVLQNKADIGIALDGDGDRIGVIDEKGQIIWGDELMVIFARSILEKTPQATFIAEVKCSQIMFDEINRLGGHPIMWKVGHSLIKQKMKEVKAVLACEMSGHVFFADRYFGFDDGIYAGARLLELLSKTEKPLSEFLTDLPVTFNTPEIRIECSDEQKFEIVRQLTQKFQQTNQLITIDGLRVLFDDGWGLVRASNTQPILVLRFEAQNPGALDRIRGIIEREIDDLLKL